MLPPESAGHWDRTWFENRDVPGGPSCYVKVGLSAALLPTSAARTGLVLKWSRSSAPLTLPASPVGQNPRSQSCGGRGERGRNASRKPSNTTKKGSKFRSKAWQRPKQQGQRCSRNLTTTSSPPCASLRRTTCAAVRRHWPRTKCELQRDAVCSLGSGKVFAAWLCSSLSGFCIWSWRSFLDVRAHTHTQRLGQQPGSGTSALPGITGCLLKGVLEFLTSSWM